MAYKVTYLKITKKDAVVLLEKLKSDHDVVVCDWDDVMDNSKDDDFVFLNYDSSLHRVILHNSSTPGNPDCYGVETTDAEKFFNEAASGSFDPEDWD
jgi:hypothetical protein